MDLLSLTPQLFESMTFDIVTTLGLRNAVWRTPGSDAGRDIEGDYFISDLSGQYQAQKWYIECKRYTKSVSWPTVWEKIAYAQTHDADILLIVTASSLSPQAVDQVNTWNRTNKKPLIRFWGATEIISKLNIYPQIAKKYGLKSIVEIRSDIFLPSMDLLMRITNSLYPDVERISNRRISLIHSVSELISIRMLDVKEGDTFFFQGHEDDDYFDWCSNYKSYLAKFDKYATRALLAYIYFTMREYPVLSQNLTLDLKIGLPRDLIESEENHIRIISYLSNFNLIFESKTIVLSLIQEESNGQ